MADRNPNQIDINLSLLSGQSGLHFDKFVKELSNVSQYLGRISKMSFPGQPGEQLSFGHEGAGASRGGSSEQITQVHENRKNSTQGGSSMPDGGPDTSKSSWWERGKMGRAASIAQKALGSIDEAGINDYRYHSGGQDFGGGGSGMPPPGPRTGGGPSHGGEGGGGPGGPDPETREGRFNYWQGRTVELPRYGELTLQDKLRMGRDVLARFAYDPDTQQITNQGAARWAERAEKSAEYLPYLQMARSGFNWASRQTYGRAQGIQEYGTTLGYQRGGKDVYPLGMFGVPMGFQLPFSQVFSQAGRRAINEDATKKWIQMQPGIGGKQVDEIFDNLYGRGYVYGAGRDRMLSSMVQLAKKNPGMDINEVGKLQDSAARFGAESLDQFTQIMNRVPDVAHAANVSVNEFMAHMDEMGKQFAEMGGTDAQGQQYAVAFSEATGMPAPIGGALLRNPFVQSRLMTQTGLLPQQQGLAGKSTLLSGSIDAAQQMVDMYKGMTGRDYKDPITGMTHHVSGRDAAMAMAAQQMGVPVAQLRSLLTHGRAKEINTAVGDLVGGRSHYIDAVENDKSLTKEEKDRKVAATLDNKHYHAMFKAMRAKGTSFTHAERQKIADAGELHAGDDPVEVAQKQATLIRKILHDHERKLSNDRIHGSKKDVNVPHVHIDLTDAAKKLIKVVADGTTGGIPGKLAKDVAQAGGNPVNAAKNLALDLAEHNPATDAIKGIFG